MRFRAFKPSTVTICTWFSWYPWVPPTLVEVKGSRACGMQNAGRRLLVSSSQSRWFPTLSLALVCVPPSLLRPCAPLHLRASQTTLGYQGGPFTPAECAAFEADPDHKVILKMRTWDEAAKVPNMKTPTLVDYKEMILRNVGSLP